VAEEKFDFEGVAEMSERVSVDLSVLLEIRRRAERFVDESESLLRILSASVEMAEHSGWSDPQYQKFKAEFLSAESEIKRGLRTFSDVVIPNLKRYIDQIESI
jgi:hypothetical protein